MIGLGVSVLLTACGDKNVKNNAPETLDIQGGIPGWLDDFYNGNYEYTQSRIDLETKETVSVMSGKITSSPYVQYVKVLEPQDSLWSEAYYYGNGEDIEALIKTDSGYVTQQQKRGYPYGYGEELIFSDPKKETLDNIECDVYETEYTVDLAEAVKEDAGKEGDGESLTAVVSQKYYVDPKNEKLIRVVTELTDLTAKTEASTFMAANGVSSEEAMEQISGEQIHEILEITAYDDDLSIEIPDYN